MKKTNTIIPGLFSMLGLVVSCSQPSLNVETTIEVPVSVIEAEISTIEEILNTSGTVSPYKEVSLYSEMSGKYNLQNNPETGKPYALGDRIQAGATIIKLEDEEYYNNLRLKSKDVSLEINRQEYEKQKSLYDKGGATLRELKNAEIGLINSEYENESSRINLAKMSVKAPFSGVIADLPYFTNGNKVNTNTLLAKIINFNNLYLETNLPEKYYNNILTGFKVYVTSYTSPGDTIVGEIIQIAPAIDPEARTFKCLIMVPNEQNKILPGMFVKADLVINSSDSTIVIPKDIIISRNRVRTVYVVDKGLAVERSITTGLENVTSVEVISGLEAGESVVSQGFETLRDNSRVKVLR